MQGAGACISPSVQEYLSKVPTNSPPRQGCLMQPDEQGSSKPRSGSSTGSVTPTASPFHALHPETVVQIRIKTGKPAHVRDGVPHAATLAITHTVGEAKVIQSENEEDHRKRIFMIYQGSTPDSMIRSPSLSEIQIQIHGHSKSILFWRSCPNRRT